MFKLSFFCNHLRGEGWKEGIWNKIAEWRYFPPTHFFDKVQSTFPLMKFKDSFSYLVWTWQVVLIFVKNQSCKWKLFCLEFSWKGWRDIHIIWGNLDNNCTSYLCQFGPLLHFYKCRLVSKILIAPSHDRIILKNKI